MFQNLRNRIRGAVGRLANRAARARGSGLLRSTVRRAGRAAGGRGG